AKLRDRIRAIERTLEKQDVAGAGPAEIDAVGHHQILDESWLVWLCMRDGRIVDTATLRVRDRSGSALAEVLPAILLQAYESRPVPAEILLALEPADREALE